ncbi:MAG: hypothetical protein E7451_05320 [Ruminococcaceae bacterium]|nr:hypothetical protein [Oscillospiraceae bacterium]
MDENEIRIPDEELPEFTLEDIMREFGSHNDDGRVHEYLAPEMLEDIPQRELIEDVPVSEQLPQREEPELLVWTPTPRAEPTPQPLSDTQSFSPVTSAPTQASGDTVRIDAAKVRTEAAKADVTADTVRFTPVGEQPGAPAPEEAEPFSANWEPQYDQPIGEYVPPEPIIFRPKNRLGELKRKLMEGPEQRYYALSEKGVGKLQIALFVSMLIVVLAVASIVLHSLDMVRDNRMRLLVFGELFAMLLSALLCWERLADGVGAIFKGKFNTDTLLAFSFAACIADGVFCLQEVKIPFCAAFCLEVLMCLWSEYQKRTTELLQMDTLRKATRLNRVAKAPDCHEGRPGFFVSEGQPEDFMDTYKLPTAPEKALNRFALLALIASVAVAVAAGVQNGLQAGVRTWSAAILAACPATMLISQTRPLHTLQRRLYRFGSVLCGWAGVKTASGKAAVPLSDEDLLPAGSVKINGVKFYSGRNPDTIIAYATAAMVESGSCLAPLFEHMLKSRHAQSYEVDEFKTYGDEGCGAIICGESVLVGTQEFLQRMGIEMPAGTKVNQAVYVSIDGEFSCVFALAFGKLKGVSAGLSALCGHRRLSPVLASCNFILSESFLHSKYGVDTRRIAFPAVSEREKLASWKPAEESCVPCALTTQEGLTGGAFAITGARSLRTASIVGAAIHILGGLVGLGAVLALTMTGRVDLLTPANLLLLELVWAVPGLLVSEWTRNM